MIAHTYDLTRHRTCCVSRTRAAGASRPEVGGLRQSHRKLGRLWGRTPGGIRNGQAGNPRVSVVHVWTHGPRFIGKAPRRVRNLSGWAAPGLWYDLPRNTVLPPCYGVDATTRPRAPRSGRAPVCNTGATL